MSTLVTPSLERRREEFYSGERTGKACASGRILGWLACEYPERPGDMHAWYYLPRCERCSMAFFAEAMARPDEVITDYLRGESQITQMEALHWRIDRGDFDAYIWKPMLEKALARMEAEE